MNAFLQSVWQDIAYMKNGGVVIVARIKVYNFKYLVFDVSIDSWISNLNGRFQLNIELKLLLKYSDFFIAIKYLKIL